MFYKLIYKLFKTNNIYEKINISDINFEILKNLTKFS